MNDDEIIAAGQAAWTHVRPRTDTDNLERWRRIGAALDVGRRLHPGRQGTRALGAWNKANGFGDIPADTRTHALWLLDNWADPLVRTCGETYPTNVRRLVTKIRKGDADPQRKADGRKVPRGPKGLPMSGQNSDISRTLTAPVMSGQNSDIPDQPAPAVEYLTPAPLHKVKAIAPRVLKLRAHAESPGPEGETARRFIAANARKLGMKPETLVDLAGQLDPYRGVEPARIPTLDANIQNIKNLSAQVVAFLQATRTEGHVPLHGSLVLAYISEAVEAAGL